MATARYYKTLFIPSLNGQHRLWKNEISKIANKVDEIIQLGNLIGCNDLVKDKDTFGSNFSMLNYVELWRSTFDNWIQIIGPNEILALNEPDKWTNKTSNSVLRYRWLSNRNRGYQVAAVSKNRLVTHGGLTYGMWVEIGRPQTAGEAAELLNEKFFGTLYQGPSWSLGDPPNFGADPIFADPLRETYPSWITTTEKMPFSQVHGGEGINTVDGYFMWNLDEGILQYLKKVTTYNFGSLSELEQGGTFLAVNALLPNDKLINKLVKPAQFYIERIPMIDLREDLFT